jgi:hypothetical protein
VVNVLILKIFSPKKLALICTRGISDLGMCWQEKRQFLRRKSAKK